MGVNALLANVNSAGAKQLAEQSSEFQADLAGHGYQFVTVGAVASINSATCSAIALGELSVDFTVKGVYYTTGNITVPEGIQVFENPALTSVIGVTVDEMAVQGLSFYSGWEAQYMSGGYAQPLYETQQNYDQPSMGYNSNCYTCTTRDTIALCHLGVGCLANTGVVDSSCSREPISTFNVIREGRAIHK